ncbi:MAG: hypothetical protein IPK03_01590 [Bacteroidetes bacterium]|nr:hypothetical protein [Bacteroidota bacterium]
MPYRKPKILKGAGSCFVCLLRILAGEKLRFRMAGTAAAYGLSKEEALASITSDVLKYWALANALEQSRLGKVPISSFLQTMLSDMRTKSYRIGLYSKERSKLI